VENTPQEDQNHPPVSFIHLYLPVQAGLIFVFNSVPAEFQDETMESLPGFLQFAMTLALLEPINGACSKICSSFKNRPLPGGHKRRTHYNDMVSQTGIRARHDTVIKVNTEATARAITVCPW
jgi:hypothetical protein